MSAGNINWLKPCLQWKFWHFILTVMIDRKPDLSLHSLNIVTLTLWWASTIAASKRDCPCVVKTTHFNFFHGASSSQIAFSVFISPLSIEINVLFFPTCKNTLYPYFQKDLVKFVFIVNSEAKWSLKLSIQVTRICFHSLLRNDIFSLIFCFYCQDYWYNWDCSLKIQTLTRHEIPQIPIDDPTKVEHKTTVCPTAPFQNKIQSDLEMVNFQTLGEKEGGNVKIITKETAIIHTLSQILST